MPSDLSSYLATRYLVADPKPTKKRKRKQKGDDDNAGLIIADESESGWKQPTTGSDDEDSVVVAGTSAEFRKAKKSAWKVVGSAASATVAVTSSTTALSTPQAQTQDPDSQTADAILASAAAETAALASSNSQDDAPAVLMSDGTHAGLQSAATVSAQLEARREAERAEYEKSRAEGGAGADAEAETIYRDATGRRVDVSLRRAELRREAAEAAAREAAKVEALRGEVQIEDARRRREMLDEAKVMPLARHADDADLNREMRDQVRWGDTMARFIEPKGDGAGGGAVAKSGGGEKGKKTRTKGRPVYQGAWTPNRYGIRPGYRWDGVDRGNGFEAERFKAINRRERNKGLEYSWQMDE
ncbi:Pre-mRNA-splicing factor of RES complex-domain-containing protein [Hypoxylon sp. NC1633]|nr:Pre-mRNA-splicing factor of RES complex-domain-containing protein [Hypoxylon sp. NC1633]